MNFLGSMLLFGASQGQLHNDAQAPSIDKYASFDLQAPDSRVFSFPENSKGLWNVRRVIRENMTSFQKVQSGWKMDPDWRCISYPIGSMYGIFTYIYHKNQPNVGKYAIHGSYGHWIIELS